MENMDNNINTVMDANIVHEDIFVNEVKRTNKSTNNKRSNKYFILGLQNGFLNVILLFRGCLVCVNSLPKLLIARCPSGIGFFVPRARIIKKCREGIPWKPYWKK